MPLAALDWSLVLAALVTSIPATIAAVTSLLNRREIKTPNGVKLGELVAQTHDLAEVSATEVQKVVSGEVSLATGQVNETGGTDDAP